MFHFIHSSIISHGSIIKRDVQRIKDALEWPQGETGLKLICEILKRANLTFVAINWLSRDR